MGGSRVGTGRIESFAWPTGRLAEWMRENGLEWLLQLKARSLRRHYLVTGSKFAWSVSLELLGLNKFE